MTSTFAADGAATVSELVLDLLSMLVLKYWHMKKRESKGEDMVTTTISLDRATYRRLGHLAVDEDTTIRDLVRRAVEEYLQWQKGGKS